MAVSTETLQRAEESDVKGKAVYVLHTWKDALWNMGVSQAENVPEPRAIQTDAESSQDVRGSTEAARASPEEARDAATTNGYSAQASSETVDVSSSAETSAPPLSAEGR